MFERSMIESQGRVASAEQRWTAMASVTLQVALAGLVVALPLLHPEALPFWIDAPKMFMPPVKLPEVRPVIRSAAARVEAVAQSDPFVAPIGILPKIGKIIDEGPPMQTLTAMNMSAMPTGINTAADGPVRAVRVVPAIPDKPMTVSGGVAAGRLLAPIRPVYPAIAKAAGLQGTVVVEAIISKAGTIESLRVISGPELLRRAATYAIEQARYQPFRLNGEPTDVQTTITVNFRLGS